jgi:hypothetical protein
MVIRVAVFIHYTRAMPEGGTPSAPIFVSSVGIEDEPASFHLRVSELPASQTRHLAFIERQIHVFGGISV